MSDDDTSTKQRRFTAGLWWKVPIALAAVVYVANFAGMFTPPVHILQCDQSSVQLVVRDTFDKKYSQGQLTFSSTRMFNIAQTGNVEATWLTDGERSCKAKLDTTARDWPYKRWEIHYSIIERSNGSCCDVMLTKYDAGE